MFNVQCSIFDVQCSMFDIVTYFPIISPVLFCSTLHYSTLLYCATLSNRLGVLILFLKTSIIFWWSFRELLIPLHTRTVLYSARVPSLIKDFQPFILQLLGLINFSYINLYSKYLTFYIFDFYNGFNGFVDEAMQLIWVQHVEMMYCHLILK